MTILPAYLAHFLWNRTGMHANNLKSTLVQVMVWCHQAPSHYLSKCWTRSMSPYGIARAQWHDDVITWKPFPYYWHFVREICGFLSHKGNNVELWCFLCCYSEQTFKLEFFNPKSKLNKMVLGAMKNCQHTYSLTMGWTIHTCKKKEHKINIQYER